MRYVRRALFALAVAVFVLFSLGPLLLIVVSSLRPKAEFFRVPPRPLPENWTLDNYRKLVQETDFLTFLGNSLYVTVVTVLACTAIATLGAYSLARFRYPGRGLFLVFSLFAYLLPPVLLAIPLFVLGSKVGLVNTLSGLGVAYVALTLPYCLWLLRAFFLSVPTELEEAAAIDGASPLRTIFSVVLPVSLPGIIATAVYSFSYVWNDYLFALIFITSGSKMTFPLGLRGFITDFDIYWEYILAGSVLVSIPTIAVLLPTQELLIKGWGSGALKG